MSQIKTIFKNVSWLFISQIIATICAFIWTILIARYLGVSDYGIIGFAISFTVIVGMTTDFGISLHVVRHVSTNYDSAPKYLGNIIPLKVLFSLGTFILSLLILIVMGCDKLTIIITLLFTIEKIFSTMLSLFIGTFQAFEKGKYQSIINSSLNLILLAFILISIYFDLGIYGIAVSYLLANLIIVIYGYYIIRKEITTPKFELDKEFCKKITLYSIPFALTGLFSTIYNSIDMVMINHMVGSYANGIYNAAYKLITVFLVFYTIYSAVFFPVMNKFYVNEKNMLVVIFEKSVKYLMLLMIPLAVFTTFYSTDIIYLIYGNDYLNADLCLSILIWTVCLIFVNGASNTLLNASHKEKSVTIIYLMAAIFNVGINLVLIPNYSYVGASIATVLSDLLIFVLFIIIVFRIGTLPGKNLVFDFIKILIGSLILYGVLSILNVSMWLAIPISIIVYLLLLIVMKTFDDGDKFIIKEIIGK